MKKPNSSRYNKEIDNYTYNSNTSAFSLFEDNKVNNKTEQIKLRRNLLQSNFKVLDENEEVSTPNMISERSSEVDRTPEQPEIPLITYEEAYKYFQSLVYPNQDNNIQKKSSSFCSCSSEKLEKEKVFLASLNKIKYDKNNNIHFRILFSIYYFFTKKNCQKEGEHWQDIGFQSDTPNTDLYSVGMYGPLQILYGINKYPSFYSNLFEYLLKRKCDLFFAVNMISFTKFSYNVFERGILDSDIKENNSLLIALNEVYVGMGYDFSNEIQQYGNNNILTIEFIVKTIQNISEKRIEPRYFLKNHQKSNNF